MNGKETLLKESEEGYLELQESIAGLDEARATEPWLGTWGVREILGHASGWLIEMRPALERLRRGEGPYPEGVSYDDFDAWNAKFADARRGVKLADLLAELEISHRDFMAAARLLPEEQFAPEMAGRALIENCASQHYREHAGQIREWRREHR